MTPRAQAPAPSGSEATPGTATTAPGNGDSPFLPSVSVIVPVWNAERTLRGCLASLLALDYPGALLEIVVVDNGSTDRTRGILRQFAPVAGGRGRGVSGARDASTGDDLPSLRVLFESVRGPGAARNRGLHAASGEVVAFTDADCVAERDWLRALVQPLADPAVGVAAGRILARRPATAIERFGETLDDHERATSAKIQSAITMNWASPTELIREMGGFDPTLLRTEDSDLSFRIFLDGHAFRYVPSAVVYHRNPGTLQALFHKGYQHGTWLVAFDKKHHRARRALGVRQVDTYAYGEMFRQSARCLAGTGGTDASCSVAFEAGKKVGRAVGSVRHGHLYL